MALSRLIYPQLQDIAVPIEHVPELIDLFSLYENGIETGLQFVEEKIGPVEIFRASISKSGITVEDSYSCSDLRPANVVKDSMLFDVRSLLKSDIAIVDMTFP